MKFKNYFFSMLTFAVFLLSSIGYNHSFGQGNAYIRDTVSMETDRTHDLYYSLKTGEKYQQPGNNWDIQFSTAVMDVTIRTNGGRGVTLYVYPWADTSGWNSVDTNGLSMFPALYNSDKNWEMGAFNVNTTGSELDYGWGVYNIFTHKIAGDSLFIIKFAQGSSKKLWIIEKNPMQNKYEFKYANLDGTDETTVTFSGNDYSSKAFVGYSFATKQFVDREPEMEKWDLLFTKFITFYNNVMWYPVTGVLANYDVEIASNTLCDTATVTFAPTSLDSANISVIGNNWFKMVSMKPPVYEIYDSLVYFVSDQESSIWKLVFEYYNSSEGKIGFRKKLVEDHSAITEISGFRTGKLAISPNPVESSAQVLFNADNGGEAILNIVNMAGKTVFRKNVAFEQGLNSTTLELSHLSNGIYIVSIQSGNYLLQNKLIKN